jgi:hypothetical protein
MGSIELPKLRTQRANCVNWNGCQFVDPVDRSAMIPDVNLPSRSPTFPVPGP